MARRDWSIDQARYIAAWEKTGISPKAWCEEQGINYQSARRYILKPKEGGGKKTAQIAQKKERKVKNKSAQKNSAQNCAKELVEDDGLTSQQKLFVAEYLKDNNATSAAIRAGYSEKTANKIGPELLGKTRVVEAIAKQQKAAITRTLISADNVLADMWQIATFDANQISQYRRVACRHCWGFGFQYQWRDVVEYEEKCEEARNSNKKEPRDTGGYGYTKKREPNPECPRCDGDGLGSEHFADTRKLTGAAAMAYSGVKVGKNGIEINTISRERMFEAMMKRLGLADSESAQKLQLLEIERRELENEKLRKSLGTSSGEQGGNDADEEFKRLRNDKLKAEIENLRNGANGSEAVIIHNSLKPPGSE